ncbi:MAG: phage scaffolding protein, partial [Clostridium sp.]|nr:phage scaffolding protein [Clostridium sp.]
MKTEFLKELGLSEEQIKSVMTENGKDVEKEKAKTIEANAKLEDINNQLETANTTIKDLKKNNADNEALQTKVKEYEDNMKTQKAEYEAKVRNLTLDAAIEKALG